MMYYYEDVEGGGIAPRLPVQSIASRVLITGVLVCCCGIIAFSMLFVASLFATLPRVVPQPALGPGSAVVSIDARAPDPGLPPSRTHPPRSVLQRLAMLKRAQAPARGVDRVGARAVFPHWLAEKGEWDAATVLDDVVLALSYLARDANTHTSVQ